MKQHSAAIAIVAFAVFIASSASSVYPDWKLGRVPLGTVYLQARPEWPWVLSGHVVLALGAAVVGYCLGVVIWRLLRGGKRSIS